MGKNKGVQVGELSRLIRILKEDWIEFRGRVQKEQASFRKEWADKFNGMQDRFQKIVVATGQQLAQINANQQVHSNVLEALDVNIQATAKAVREVYGRFQQIDHHLQSIAQPHGSDVGVDFELSQENLAVIKDRAQDAYDATMKECFRQVHEERKAAIEEQRRAAEEAKKKAVEEAAAAVKAKEEASTAEEVLQEAESSSRLSTQAGGQGSDIPAGAEVFGG